MPKRSKQENQRFHARQRARERYDLEFTDPVRSTFLARIHRGETTVVARQSLRVTVHDVRYNGQTYRVVYDANRREIVTFLLPDWEPW